MEISKRNRPNQKMKQLEISVMDALAHPEDGEQRRRYIKRFLYGEGRTKQKTVNSKKS